MKPGNESSPILGYTHLRDRPVQPNPSVRRKPLNTAGQTLFQHRPPTRAHYDRLNNAEPAGNRGLSRNTSVTLPSISEVRSSHDHGQRPFTHYDNAAQDQLRSHGPVMPSEDVSWGLNDSSRVLHEGVPDGKRLSIYDSTKDWKPWLLNYVGTFICCLLGHFFIFAIGRYFTLRNGIFARSTPADSWFFRFAPSFLVVFVKEWCTRLTVDYRSIDAYFPYSLRHQERPKTIKARLFEDSKLYSMGFWRATFGHTVFDVVGYFASILVIIHSTIVDQGLVSVASDASFATVNPQPFLDAFDTSMIPSLTVPSYFMNQSIAKPSWYAELPSSFGLIFTQVGVLPFHATDQHAESDSSTCVTSGYAGSLDCLPIQNPLVRMRSAGTAQWDVLLSLNDSAGCQFQSTFSGVQLTGPQNFSSGAVGDNTFAVWKYLEDDSNNAKSVASCSPTKQFLLSGRVAEKDLPSSKEYVNVAAQGTGWAGLSCTSPYIQFNNNLAYTTFSNGSASTTNALTKHDATGFSIAQSLSFDRAMRTNFLDTGFIAQLGGWWSAKTFWNATAPYSWFGARSNDNNGQLCAAGSSLMSVFKNFDTCNMYVNIETLWPLLFALSTSTTASYMPESSWKQVQGQVTKQKLGWYVGQYALYLSAFFHFFVILFLITARMIHFPHFLPRIFHRYFGHRRSGLKRNPSTIVAKAELFLEPRTRNLLTGIDALDRKEAEAEARARIEPVKFKMRVKQFQSVTNPQRHLKESAFIDTRDSTRLLEYEDIKELPNHEDELVRLRFAYAPLSLHWLILLSTFLIICIIFAGGVYMTQNDKGYFFWHQPLWSLRTRTTWLVWGQQLAFSILPTVILLALRWWWTNIDTFFRASQPYVGLHHSLPGKHSVCLKYINDIDIVVTLKSFKNKHLRLTFVTVITLLVKLALALAGGLFFFREGTSKHAKHFQLSQTWRNDTFAVSAGSFDAVALRSTVIYSISDYARTSAGGWQKDLFIFPGVIASEGKFEMQLPGLSADLDCEQVSVDFLIRSGGGGSLTAKLNNNDCGYNEWSNFCYFPESGLIGQFYTKSLSTSRTSTFTSSTTSKSTSKMTSTSPSSSQTISTSRSSSQATTSAIVRTTTSISQTTTLGTTIRTSTITSSLPAARTTTQLTSTRTSSTVRIAIPAPAPTMPGTTAECYDWYIPQPGEYCWEIAEQFDIDWQVLRTLNPNIDAGCLNLQPYRSYCVDGINPGKTRRAVKDVTTSDLGVCTGWKYIDATKCGPTSGRWWIVDAHGTPFSAGNSSLQGLSSITSSNSLLCKPRFWMNQVDVTIYNFPTLGFFNLTVGKVASSIQITDSHWLQKGNSTSFSDYFSTGLQKYGFAGGFNQLSATHFLDVMSLAAASNSTKLTAAFQDPAEFKRVASVAFGRAFTQVVNRTISSDGSTFLLQSAPDSQSVVAHEYILNAIPSKVPLYATMIVLALYAIALGFVLPDKSRRMPLDPHVIANVVASIYDSSIISKVRKVVERGGDPVEELKDVRFSFGVYTGESSRVRRLGIDVDDMISPIRDPTEGLSPLQRLRRRTPWQRNNADDEKPMDQGSDYDIPYIAEYREPQELGTGTHQRGDYEIPNRRYSMSGFVPRQHGPAEETGYPPPRRVETMYDAPSPQAQPNQTAPPPSRAQTIRSRIGTILAPARRIQTTDALLEEEDDHVVAAPPNRTATFDDRTRMNRDGEAGLWSMMKKHKKSTTVTVRNVGRDGYAAPDSGVPRPRGYVDSFKGWINRW